MSTHPFSIAMFLDSRKPCIPLAHQATCPDNVVPDTHSDIDEFFHLPHIVRPGETISSTHLTKRAGGKGANQSYSIAKAGGAVVLDGAVGSDGEWVKELLRSGGVDVGRVRVVQEEVGPLFVIILYTSEIEASSLP